MSLSLEDVRGIVKDAVDPMREDIQNLFRIVSDVKDLVNPVIQKHSDAIELIKKDLEEHTQVHEKQAKERLQEESHMVTKKAFRWQRGFIIFLVVMNIITVVMQFVK